MDNQPLETKPYVPPKKSSGHGCLIASLIVGGLFLFAVLALVLFGYRYVQSGKGKAIWNAFKEATAIAEQGMNAPGTAELRELGCKQAFVMDTSQLAKLGEAFSGIGGKPSEKSSMGTMVVCMVGYLGRGPSCDEAAAVYVKALGGSAPHPFVVMVKAQSSSKADCFSSYSPDGKLQKNMPMPDGKKGSDVEKPE